MLVEENIKCLRQKREVDVKQMRIEKTRDNGGSTHIVTGMMRTQSFVSPWILSPWFNTQKLPFVLGCAQTPNEKALPTLIESEQHLPRLYQEINCHWS